jgi:hypothetical protein
MISMADRMVQNYKRFACGEVHVRNLGMVMGVIRGHAITYTGTHF